MDKLEEFKKILHVDIEEIIKKNQKITPEIIKQELVSFFNEIFDSDIIDDYITVKRNEYDKNVIDITLYGYIGYLVRTNLEQMRKNLTLENISIEEEKPLK